MSIKKRVLAAIAAMSMVVTSVVAMTTASAATPTFTATLMTADELADCTDVAVAGVNLTFVDFEKNIGALQFDLTIPKDLKVEVNTGTPKKPVWENLDITDDTIADAVLADFDFSMISKKSEDETSYTFGFIVGGLNLATDSVITIFFCSDDENYVLPEAGFKVSNASMNYYGETSPISNLAVANPASAATPEPTATATPTPTPVVTPEPTPTVEPTPEVTPEPTTGKGAITADASDAAAWAWKTAAAAGSEVEVTVKADDKTATKAFALKAAVDGTVKVGVIVQYNPANFTSFEIVDINVK